MGRVMTQIGTPEYFAEMSCNEQHDSFVLVARRVGKVNFILLYAKSLEQRMGTLS